MAAEPSKSPFTYDPAALRVRSVDPEVRILSDEFTGGSDGYRAYAVAIAKGPYVFCYYASHEYLMDAGGAFLVTADGRPAGWEITNVRTRWTHFDRHTGETFKSTFPEDEKSYRGAVALAVAFYSSAKMLRSDAPLRRIAFDPSERAYPMVVELPA